MGFAAASLYKLGKDGGILDLTLKTKIPESYFEETPETRQLLDNVTKAMASPQRGMEAQIAAMLSYVGSRTLSYARKILRGHPAPGMAVAAAHQATMDLRHENRQSNNPLMEYGVLERNLVARISQNSLEVFVNRGERKPPYDRPGQQPLSGGMNALAAMLENGFTLNVTPRAKLYFEFQWHNVERELEGKGTDADYVKINNMYLARTALLGWKRLASLPIGKHQVEARPFIGPAASRAVNEFFERDFPGWAKHMENWLIHNKITVPGGEI